MKRASSETTDMKGTTGEGAALQTKDEAMVPVSASASAETRHSELPRTISMDGMTNESTCSRKKPRVCPSETETVAAAIVSPFQGKNYTNLISETTSKVLFATDEWFARAENLIKDSPPVFDPDLYCLEGMFYVYAFQLSKPIPSSCRACL